MAIKRPLDQSNAQWLADYAGEPVDAIQRDLDRIAHEHQGQFDKPRQPNEKPISEPMGQTFEYAGHRTTTKGALVLDFTDKDSGEVCSAFFNVSIEYQRGPKAGRARRTGEGCQFHPKPRSKFRRFWIETVGHPPRRWSESHKEMRSRLSRFIFAGQIESATFGSGDTYLRMKKVHKIGDVPVTRKRQESDNAATTQRQLPATSKPRKASKQKAFKQSKLHDTESTQKHATRTHYHTDALPSSYSSCFVEVF